MNGRNGESQRTAGAESGAFGAAQAKGSEERMTTTRRRSGTQRAAKRNAVEDAAGMSRYAGPRTAAQGAGPRQAAACAGVRSLPVSRRSFVVALSSAVAAAALLQLTGCGSTSASSDGAYPDSLTMVFADAPTSLDPAVDWSGWYTGTRGLTETLVQFDEDMELAPLLAAAWENVDDLTWSIKLRSGVSFQTGRAMTPDAVKASLERSVSLSKRAALKLHLDSIEVQGDDALVIRTTEPVPTLPGELCEPVFSIVDVDEVDQNPNHAGTGPYGSDEPITAYDSYTLDAFADYWGGAPKVAHLVMKTVTDANARAMGIRSGDCDVAYSIQAADLAALRGSSGCTIVESETVRTDSVIINFRNAQLADSAVRQALSYATDRETLCSNLLQGSLIAHGTPFPSSAACTAAVGDEAQTFDRDRAIQLLEAAGYTDADGDGYREKDGTKLSFRLAYYASRPELPTLAAALQDAYKQIGIEIVPQQYENISTVYYAGDFDLMLYNATTLGNGDPAYYLGLYFKSDGSENAGAYANAQLDAVIDAMDVEFDSDARTRLAEQAQSLILEDCPYVFIGSPTMNLVEGSRASGFVMRPVEWYGVTNEVL
jgi:peptide/nickel transport system substrate-binding protein